MRRESPALPPGAGTGRRLSRVATVTLAAAVTFIAAGLGSGLLIDEYGGVLGALEWLLRTLVVIAAAMVIVGGTILAFRLHRRVRPRPAGWAFAGVAWLAFSWLVAIPVGFAVYLTHLPGRSDVRAVDVGAFQRDVTVTGADGLRLRGSYVPSENGAAVIAMHGTGSNRNGVWRHTRMLARHGYGVLALDLRGHGESQGRSTSAPWKAHEDVHSAVEWLSRRPEVDDDRIGLLGVSFGGEVALQVAGRGGDVRAVVAEGAQGGAPDARAAGADPLTMSQLTVMSALSSVLTGAELTSDADLVERFAPRPLLLISAGRSIEAKANRMFTERGAPVTEHWNLPDAPHAQAARTDPHGYERRVVGFLDRALDE